MKFDDEKSGRDRFREREREREEEEAQQKSSAHPKAKPGEAGVAPSLSVDDVMEQIRIADMTIDQIHNLYQMFFSGIERLPPLEKQNHLEKMVIDLQTKIALTPASRFRFNTLHARFLSYKDRWDKSMKDLEAGNIKRTVNAGRK